MTIKELYEWAKEMECTDCDVSVECYDYDGETSEVQLNEERLLKLHTDKVYLLIRCCE